MRLNVLESKIFKKIRKCHPLYHDAILHNHKILVEKLLVNYKI